MPQRPYKTWVEISRSALVANARALKRAVGEQTALMAVVKANAYGHGLSEVVQALTTAPAKSIDWYGVDTLREAEAIRSAEPTTKRGKIPILILGYTPLSDIPKAVKSGYRVTAYDLATLRAAVKSATQSKPARIHLKLETGTSRQGILEKNLPTFIRTVQKMKHVSIEGLSTHYANIEDTTDPSYAKGQLATFQRMCDKVRVLGIDVPIIHTAASAAAILYPETHFSLARTGIALYGLWPSKETRISATDKSRGMTLRPALTWKTIVAQVKDLPAGTPISYGLTEKVTRKSRVAVIPIGYWDGYDRKLSSMGRVLIKGKRAKVLGRICMNMCVVDVTDIPGVKAEDEVVILGTQGKETITAEDIASMVGTINYEIVTRINPTIPRVIVA